MLKSCFCCFEFLVEFWYSISLSQKPCSSFQAHKSGSDIGFCTLHPHPAIKLLSLKYSWVERQPLYFFQKYPFLKVRGKSRIRVWVASNVVHIKREPADLTCCHMKPIVTCTNILNDKPFLWEIHSLSFWCPVMPWKCFCRKGCASEEQLPRVCLTVIPKIATLNRN